MKGLTARLTTSLIVATISGAALAAPEAATVRRSYFAVVTSTGDTVRSTDDVTSSRLGLGLYRVIFPVSVARCAYLANVGSTNRSREMGGSAKTNGMPGNAKGVEIQIGSQGAAADRDFHLGVLC